MSTKNNTAETSTVSSGIARNLLLLMTTAIAATAANLYYNQPILPLIAKEFGLNDTQLASIPAFTALGYAMALLFISPLGDALPRRKLISILSVVLTLSSFLAFIAPNVTLLLIAVFLIGLSANITQQLIPFAASMVSPKEKGATLGTLMMGLTLGILLSRTVSGFVGEQLGWRAVFAMSGLFAIVFGAMLYKALPNNTPQHSSSYASLIKSTFTLFKTYPALRIFTLSGAFWFAAFNILWATLALHLHEAPFHYNAQQTGLFGVIALAGVIGAKLSGKSVNRLGSKRLVTIAMLIIAFGFALSGWLASSLAALIIAIILIDFGVFSAQVANQVRVFSLNSAAQSRINGVYMLGYYAGGSIGAFLGIKVFHHFAWEGVTILSIALITAGLLVNQFAPKH